MSVSSICSILALVVAGFLASGCVSPKVGDDRAGADTAPDVTLAASEAYDVITALTKERPKLELERNVYFENYELDDVVERLLKPLDLTWTYHDDVDRGADVSGVIGAIPAQSLTEILGTIGLIWHAGRSTVYIYPVDATPDDEVYLVSYRLAPAFKGTLTPELPNAYAAYWRLKGGSWPGMNSALTAVVVDSQTMQVTGFASDHAFVMERVGWAVSK